MSKLFFMPQRPARAAFVAAFLCMAVAPLVPAASITWTAGLGNWSDGSKWNQSGAIPQNGVGAASWDVFANSGNINQDIASVTVGSIQLSSVNAHVNVVTANSLYTGSLSGNGAITVFNQGTLSVNNPTAFTGSITLTSTNRLTQLQLGSGTLNGVIELDGFSTGGNVLSGITGLESLVNRGTVQGNLGNLGNVASLVNAGLIASTAGPAPDAPGHLTISAYRFENQGTVQVSRSSYLDIASPHFANYAANTLTGGSWDLAGTLLIDGADIRTVASGTGITLRANGSFNDGNRNALRNLSLNNGNVLLTGAGASLSLGAVENASLLAVDSGAVLSTGVLHNDTSGRVTVGAQASATLTGSGLRNDGVLQVLSGTADFRSGALNTFANLDAATETLNGGTYRLGATGTLIYDAGTGVNGGQILHLGANSTVDLARGGQFQFGPAGQDALAQLNSNAGTLAISGGVHTFTPAGGTFTNSGQMSVGGGAVSHIAGGLANTSSGIVSVSGNGTLNISGNAINSGYIEVAQLAQFNAGLGILNNSTLVVGGAVTADNVTNTGFIGIQSGSGAAATAAVTTFDNNAGGDVVVGAVSGSTLDTASGFAFHNAGTVSIQAQGLVDFSSYTQTGGQTNIDGGILEASTVSLTGGDITGHGAIVGSVENSGGNVETTGGDLTIYGDYTQTDGGSLTDDLFAGNIVDVRGNVALSGLFKAFFSGPSDLAIGNRIEILRFTGSISGDFTGFDLASPGEGLEFREVRSGQDVFLEVQAAQATPEPASLFTMGAGLIGLAMLGKRLRKAS